MPERAPRHVAQPAAKQTVVERWNAECALQEQIPKVHEQRCTKANGHCTRDVVGGHRHSVMPKTRIRTMSTAAMATVPSIHQSRKDRPAGETPGLTAPRSVNIPNPAWLRREETNGGQDGTGWLMRMMIAVPMMMGATTTPI